MTDEQKYDQSFFSLNFFHKKNKYTIFVGKHPQIRDDYINMILGFPNGINTFYLTSSDKAIFTNKKLALKLI